MRGKKDLDTVTETQIPQEENKFGFWSFFLFIFVFALPVIGFIVAIVFSFMKSNPTRAAFSRSVLVWKVVVLLLVAVFALIVVSALSAFIGSLGIDIGSVAQIGRDGGIGSVISYVTDDEFIGDTIKSAIDNGQIDKIIESGTVDKVLSIVGTEAIVSKIDPEIINESSPEVVKVDEALEQYDLSCKEVLVLIQNDEQSRKEVEEVIKEAGGVAGVMEIYKSGDYESVVELVGEETLGEWAEKLKELGLNE